MTEQRPDSAAGPPRWKASGGGLVTSRHRSVRGGRAAAGGRFSPTGFGRAARCPARPARILAHHKGRRDRHHAHQRLRDRRDRRAGPRRAGAVLGSRPDAVARQHAPRRGRSGRRVAVVSVVGRQHSHRSQRAHRARGTDGRRRGHLRRAGHARGPAHRRRFGFVVAADRRRTAAVAHRNRFAFRRTRRDTPRRGGSAAARSPTAPSPTSNAAAAVCATSNCSTPWRSPNSPMSIPADRWRRRPRHSVRPISTLLERPHRTAPGVGPRPRTAAGPARRRDRRGAAHR